MEMRTRSPPNGMSLDLLRAVYRNPSIPLPVRLRAAMACLPHEAPKLAVTYQASETDFAEMLDRRIKHMEQMKMIPPPSAGAVEVKPTVERMRRRI